MERLKSTRKWAILIRYFSKIALRLNVLDFISAVLSFLFFISLLAFTLCTCFMLSKAFNLVSINKVKTNDGMYVNQVFLVSIVFTVCKS